MVVSSEPLMMCPLTVGFQERPYLQGVMDVIPSHRIAWHLPLTSVSSQSNIRIRHVIRWVQRVLGVVKNEDLSRGMASRNERRVLGHVASTVQVSNTTNPQTPWKIPVDLSVVVDALDDLDFAFRTTESSDFFNTA